MNSLGFYLEEDPQEFNELACDYYEHENTNSSTLVYSEGTQSDGFIYIIFKGNVELKKNNKTYQKISKQQIFGLEDILNINQEHMYSAYGSSTDCIFLKINLNKVLDNRVKYQQIWRILKQHCYKKYQELKVTNPTWAILYQNQIDDSLHFTFSSDSSKKKLKRGSMHSSSMSSRKITQNYTQNTTPMQKHRKTYSQHQNVQPIEGSMINMEGNKNSLYQREILKQPYSKVKKYINQNRKANDQHILNPIHSNTSDNFFTEIKRMQQNNTPLVKRIFQKPQKSSFNKKSDYNNQNIFNNENNLNPNLNQNSKKKDVHQIKTDIQNYKQALKNNKTEEIQKANQNIQQIQQKLMDEKEGLNKTTMGDSQQSAQSQSNFKFIYIPINKKDNGRTDQNLKIVVDKISQLISKKYEEEKQLVKANNKLIEEQFKENLGIQKQIQEKDKNKDQSLNTKYGHSMINTQNSIGQDKIKTPLQTPLKQNQQRQPQILIHTPTNKDNKNTQNQEQDEELVNGLNLKKFGDFKKSQIARNRIMVKLQNNMVNGDQEMEVENVKVNFNTVKSVSLERSNSFQIALSNMYYKHKGFINKTERSKSNNVNLENDQKKIKGVRFSTVNI